MSKYNKEYKRKFLLFEQIQSNSDSLNRCHSKLKMIIFFLILVHSKI